MRKIGIITICDYKNYGNRLQNYASQEIFKEMGYNVETIVNKPPEKDIYDKKVDLPLRIRIKNTPVKLLLKKVKRKIKAKLNEKKYSELRASKEKAFIEFTRHNIKESSFMLTPQKIFNEKLTQYEYFVVGSDQIWNPVYRNGFEVDFLTFAPVHKRIAYAPSFGIATIPEQFIERYTNWLEGIKYLSVREEAGAKIIKDLVGKEAVVLIDPTLMLTKEKWLSISKAHQHKPKEEYLVTYFLGDISKETKRTIKEIKKRYKLKVVNLANLDSKDTYAADPGEFIDYINSSKIFLTDSFHGVVFSIIFKKAFIVFDRQGDEPVMSSRIDTLFSKFELHERSWENVKKHCNLFDVDYSNIDKKLQIERTKALEYLKEALCNE